jgi:fluoride exporter
LYKYWCLFVAALVRSAGASKLPTWWQSRSVRAQQWFSQVMRNKMFLVFVGGSVGCLLRYWVGKWFNSQPWGQVFPFGTLFINVSGSLILGAAAVIILERMPPEYQDWYLLLGTGFCGGYTTFSTFEWETFRLVRDGSWWFALANVGGSVLIGFVGVLLGVLLASRLFPR